MAYENIPLHVNAAQHRFEMNIDGEYAFIIYRQSGNTVNLIHTEVAQPLEGQGVAATLVKKTLQYLEEHHLNMVPSCPYVQHYLRRHAEWNRLVANE
ncbi:N-acetyltransferase [Ilyomonas limi]|uniref:N-acetyltransferase n=1 Tax=Ilyomonas limi TaxID=2575867 RepID=A0A4U3L6Y7_9BACT|nr:GNAT family N-acetyltransferase [Ilyomonas limi]TKK69387.1 N-acetyltransferase [Ilyomonas limi]